MITATQTRYRDRGTSNRLSDAFESTVAGPSLLAFTQPVNEDYSLTYLQGYGPSCAFSMDSGTLFGFTSVMPWAPVPHTLPCTVYLCPLTIHYAASPAVLLRCCAASVRT
jgi:hypothetical protein